MSQGWVRTFRANRFIALNDGSCLSNIQCVDNELYKKLLDIGDIIGVEGNLFETKVGEKTGSITFTSKSNVGTTFNITFPKK